MFGKKNVLLPLIIGSVMPDLFYFLPIHFSRSFSHSISGLFLLNLPVALILYYLFGFIGRKPLRELLPHFLQRKMKPLNVKETKFNFADFLITICAVLVGIISHLLWDNLTHESWISIIFPFHIKRPLSITIFGGGSPLFFLIGFSWHERKQLGNNKNIIVHNICGVCVVFIDNGGF